MTSIQNLCTRCLLLHDGRVTCDDRPDEAIRRYLRAGAAQSSVDLRQHPERVGNGHVRLTRLTMCNSNDEPVQGISIGEACRVYIEYESADGFKPQNVEVGVAFISVLGMKAVMFSNVVAGHPFRNLAPAGRICCSVPSLPLASGEYVLGVSISCNGATCDWVDGAMRYTIWDTDFYGSGRRYHPGSTCVYLPHEWRIL